VQQYVDSPCSKKIESSFVVTSELLNFVNDADACKARDKLPILRSKINFKANHGVIQGFDEAL
jgi:hypothetical protein